MAVVVSSLLETGPVVPFRMVSAAKLTIPEFPEPLGAGSLDFPEQYLSFWHALICFCFLLLFLWVGTHILLYCGCNKDKPFLYLCVISTFSTFEYLDPKLQFTSNEWRPWIGKKNQLRRGKIAVSSRHNYTITLLWLVQVHSCVRFTCQV